MGKRAKRSAYFVFSEIERKRTREELVAEGAEKVSVADVAKKLGEKWRSLTEEDKRKYAEMAQAEGEEAAKNTVTEADEEGKSDPDQEKEALTIPLSLVRKIILLDSDVKKVSKEAVENMAVATEALLEFLALESGKISASLNKKSIRFEDVHAAARKFPQLEFVDEHLILVESENRKLQKREKGEERPDPKPPTPEKSSSKRITDFFKF